MPNPIRIQAEDGSVVDLAYVRDQLTIDVAHVTIPTADWVTIIDALVRALSVPINPNWAKPLQRGAEYHRAAIRQAARVVEE
jgi:hypothetical protein